jgi:uncharacterized HAD superfamily protein
MFAAFDIDGTLSEGTFSPDSETLPRLHVLKTLRMLRRAGIKIMVVTARPESYRETTETWLRRHAIPYHTLRMRARGDNRPDPELRAEQTRGASVLFDDRLDNCDRSPIPCVIV